MTTFVPCNGMHPLLLFKNCTPNGYYSSKHNRKFCQNLSSQFNVYFLNTVDGFNELLSINVSKTDTHSLIVFGTLRFRSPPSGATTYPAISTSHQDVLLLGISPEG